MFVTASQIYVFITCVALGGVFGALLSISCSIKNFIKNICLKAIPDFVVFVLCDVIYAFVSYNMKFPNVRIYMFLGIFVGIITYLKSFHILLAKIIKKIYNIIKRKKVNPKND